MSLLCSHPLLASVLFGVKARVHTMADKGPSLMICFLYWLEQAIVDSTKLSVA